MNEQYAFDEIAAIKLALPGDVVDCEARKLRERSLSGYTWNVPPTFDEAHCKAQDRWREIARQYLAVSAWLEQRRERP